MRYQALARCLFLDLPQYVAGIDDQAILPSATFYHVATVTEAPMPLCLRELSFLHDLAL